MKKLFVLTYGFLVFFIMGNLNATNTTTKELLEDAKLYNTLLKLQAKTLHSYSGYLFNIIIVGKKPNITVNFVSATDKDNLDIKTSTNQVLFVNSHATHEDRQLFKKEVEIVKPITPAKVLKESEHRVKNRKIINFNAFDANGHLLSSDYRDAENGFSIKLITYSRSGEILTMQFYIGLKINEGGRSIPVSNTKFKYVEDFLPSKHTLDFNNAETIEDFSKDLFHKVIKNEDED